MRFGQFLELGLKHIADINAYDHILFIIVTCVIFHIRDWRKILILITAFTLGHSLTLALAVTKVVNINKDFIEFLIPLTILATAIWNIFSLRNSSEVSKNGFRLHYIVVLFFGLIHGLGFSNYLGMLLGRNESILTPLLGFNIGVELGQLCIVAVFGLISFLVLEIFKIKLKYWVFAVSILAAFIAIYLMMETDFVAGLIPKSPEGDF